MAQFTLPKTWVSGEILYAADLNAQFQAVLDGFTPSQIDGASANVAAMQTSVDPYPAGTPSPASALLGELQRLRYQMNLVIGRTYWYEDPNISLETLKDVGPKVNYVVTTNGSDPGLYGMSSRAVALNQTGIGSGVIVPDTSLGSVTITKSTSPIHLKFIQDANGGNTDLPGFFFQLTTTNSGGGIYTGTFNLKLKKTIAGPSTSTIRTFSFPVQFHAHYPNTGTGSLVLNAVGDKTVTFGPSQTDINFQTPGSGSINFDPSNNASITFTSSGSGNFYAMIPFSYIDLVDISAANTGTVYELFYEFFAPTISTGTVTMSIKATGIFYAKELL